MNEHQPHFDFSGIRLDSSRPFRALQEEGFVKETERQAWRELGTIITTEARISSGLIELMEAVDTTLLHRYSLGVSKTDNKYSYFVVPNSPEITLGEVAAIASQLSDLICL